MLQLQAKLRVSIWWVQTKLVLQEDSSVKPGLGWAFPPSSAHPPPGKCF